MNFDELFEMAVMSNRDLRERVVLNYKKHLPDACIELKLDEVANILLEPMLPEYKEGILETLLFNHYWPINIKTKNYALQLKIVTLLVKAGAQYKHILSEASVDLSVVKFLLSAGASPYDLNDCGMNLLHISALRLPVDYEARIRYCMHEIKIDINHQDRTVFCNTVLHGIIANENIEQALFLLEEAKKTPAEKPLNLGLQDWEGKTILLLACKIRSIPLVCVLLEIASDYAASFIVNIPDNNGRTPLHIASLLGCSKIVELLLKNGADPTLVDIHRKTPLEYCQASNTEVVDCLKEIDIDPQRAENAPLNSLFASKFRQDIVLPSYNFLPIKLLAKKTRSPQITTILNELRHLKSQKTKTQIEKSLADNGVNPLVASSILAQTDIFLNNQLSKLSSRSILNACMDGHTTCGQLLISSLQLHADKNTDSEPVQDLLLKAIEDNDIANVNRLLAKNHLDIDRLTINKKNKRTALHRAAANGQLNLIEALIKNGANIRAIDKRGDNALHIAIKNTRFSVALYLLDKRVEAKIKNKDGKMPVDIFLNCQKPNNDHDEVNAYERLKKEFEKTIAIQSVEAEMNEQDTPSTFMSSRSVTTALLTEEVTNQLNNQSVVPGVFSAATSASLSSVPLESGDVINDFLGKENPINDVHLSAPTLPKENYDVERFEKLLKKTDQDANTFSIRLDLDKLKKLAGSHFSVVIQSMQLIMQEKGVESNFCKEYKTIPKEKGAYIYEIIFIDEEPALRLLKSLKNGLKNMMRSTSIIRKHALNTEPPLHLEGLTDEVFSGVEAIDGSNEASQSSLKSLSHDPNSFFRDRPAPNSDSSAAELTINDSKARVPIAGSLFNKDQNNPQSKYINICQNSVGRIIKGVTPPEYVGLYTAEIDTCFVIMIIGEKGLSLIHNSGKLAEADIDREFQHIGPVLSWTLAYNPGSPYYQPGHLESIMTDVPAKFRKYGAATRLELKRGFVYLDRNGTIESVSLLSNKSIFTDTFFEIRQKINIVNDYFTHPASRLAADLQFDGNTFCCLPKLAVDPIKANFFRMSPLNRLPLNGLVMEHIFSLKQEVEVFEANESIANAFKEKGNVSFKAGEYEQALNYYEQAIKKFPNFKEAWLNKTRALFKLERFELAIAAAKKAQEIEPTWKSPSDIIKIISLAALKHESQKQPHF